MPLFDWASWAFKGGTRHTTYSTTIGEVPSRKFYLGKHNCSKSVLQQRAHGRCVSNLGDTLSMSSWRGTTTSAVQQRQRISVMDIPEQTAGKDTWVGVAFNTTAADDGGDAYMLHIVCIYCKYTYKTRRALVTFRSALQACKQTSYGRRQLGGGDCEWLQSSRMLFGPNDHISKSSESTVTATDTPRPSAYERFCSPNRAFQARGTNAVLVRAEQLN